MNNDEIASNRSKTTNQSVKIQTEKMGDEMDSIGTPANLEPSATVKFILMPMNQVVTLACSLRMTVRDLKTQLSADLKMHPQHLQISHEKNRNNLI